MDVIRIALHRIRVAEISPINFPSLPIILILASVGMVRDQSISASGFSKRRNWESALSILVRAFPYLLDTYKESLSCELAQPDWRFRNAIGWTIVGKSMTTAFRHQDKGFPSLQQFAPPPPISASKLQHMLPPFVQK